MKPLSKYTTTTLTVLVLLFFAAPAYAGFINRLIGDLLGYIPGLVSGTGFLLWCFLGKDRTTTAGFYPPADITPADAAYVVNNKVRPADAVSLVIYWANKNYIRISETAEGFLLRKLRDLGEEARSYERELFGGIFRQGNDQANARFLSEGIFDYNLETVCNWIGRFHDKDPQTRIFKRLSIKALLIGSPTFFGLWYMLFTNFSAHMHLTRIGAPAMEALYLSATFVGGLALMQYALLDKREGVRVEATKWYSVFMMLAFASFLFPIIIGRTPSVWSTLEMLDISAPLGLMFTCHHRTKLGLEYMARLAFLKTAGRGEIYGLANASPRYFYDTLPYAMALGVEHEWAMKFDFTGFRPPDWYEGSTTRSTFSAFVSKLTGVVIVGGGSESINTVNELE